MISGDKKDDGQTAFSCLSSREKECINWAAEGKTFKEIARILEISPNTVRMYFDKARRKMKCANKSQLVAMAIKSGIV